MVHRVSIVAGATHAPKNCMENIGGSLKKVAKTGVLLLCRVQLVSGLLSSQYIIQRVDITLTFIEILRWCCLEKVDLLVAGGAAEWLSQLLPKLTVFCFPKRGSSSLSLPVVTLTVLFAIRVLWKRTGPTCPDPACVVLQFCSAVSSLILSFVSIVMDAL
jgi:hypothetical protein